MSTFRMSGGTFFVTNFVQTLTIITFVRLFIYIVYRYKKVKLLDFFLKIKRWYLTSYFFRPSLIKPSKKE